MLKGKSLTILIAIGALFVGLAAAAVGATFAWYSTHTADSTAMELNANGVLVVYFDDEPVVFSGELKPAVSVKGKINENVTSFDVLTTNANISEAATLATANTFFEYLNSTPEEASESGTVGADVTVTCTVKIVNQDDSEKSLSLTRDIAVIPTFSVTYDGEDPVDVVSPAFGTPFHVAGDCRVTVGITVYFRQPDDLIDPAILQAKQLILSLVSVIEPDE